MLRKALIIASLLSAPALLPAQQGAPAANPDSFRALQAAYPAEPMALPARPYRGTIMVLDETQGPPTPGETGIPRWVATHLDFNAPSGLAVTMANNLPEYLDFANGTDATPEDLSPDERQRLVAYLAPSVQIGIQARTESGEVIAECHMTTTKGILNREFRAAQAADLHLARQIALWVAEEGGIELTQPERDALARPLFGKLGESSTQPPIAGLLAGDLTACDAALAAEPDNAAVRYHTATAARNAGKGADYAAKLLTKPLPLDERPTPYPHLTQAILLDAAGARGPAMRERLVAAAAYPVSDPVYAESIARLRPEQLDDNFIVMVNPWKNRLGGRALDDARVGKLMQAAARHHLPEGGWAAADPEQRDAMAYYSRAAEDSIQAGLKKAGHVPSLVAIAMYDMLFQDRRDAIDPLFEAALKEYPGSMTLWQARLALEKPDMEGSPDRNEQLIERALKLAETHPQLGMIPFMEFTAKATATNPGGKPTPVAALRQADPAGWERALRGIALYMKGTESPERLMSAGTCLDAAGDPAALAPLASACKPETRTAAAALLRKANREAAAAAIEAAP